LHKYLVFFTVQWTAELWISIKIASHRVDNSVDKWGIISERNYTHTYPQSYPHYFNTYPQFFVKKYLKLKIFKII